MELNDPPSSLKFALVLLLLAALTLGARRDYRRHERSGRFKGSSWTGKDKSGPAARPSPPRPVRPQAEPPPPPPPPDVDESMITTIERGGERPDIEKPCWTETTMPTPSSQCVCMCGQPIEAHDRLARCPRQADPDPATTAAFHFKDGWWFRRNPDGSVTISHPHSHVDIDPASWASIVAAVSLAGDHADTFALASWLHNAMPSRWVFAAKNVRQIIDTGQGVTP